MKNESSMSSEENRLYQKFRSHNQQALNCGNHLGGIPGVFNCRFSNPYVAALQKRKRKKPTSFVPPPSISQRENTTDNINNEVVHSNGSICHNGYNSVPFWYRPLPNCNQQVTKLKSIDCTIVMKNLK